MKRLSAGSGNGRPRPRGINPVGTLAAQPSGAVFTLSNNSSGNRVLVYRAIADGSLLAVGAVAYRRHGNRRAAWAARAH